MQWDDLIQQGRHLLQMGRNLFIKGESATDNPNLIHSKVEKDLESNPFPEAAYFQENSSDDTTNPEDAIKQFRFHAILCKVDTIHLHITTK